MNKNSDMFADTSTQRECFCGKDYTSCDLFVKRDYHIQSGVRTTAASLPASGLGVLPAVGSSMSPVNSLQRVPKPVMTSYSGNYNHLHGGRKATPRGSVSYKVVSEMLQFQANDGKY